MVSHVMSWWDFCFWIQWLLQQYDLNTFLILFFSPPWDWFEFDATIFVTCTSEIFISTNNIQSTHPACGSPLSAVSMVDVEPILAFFSLSPVMFDPHLMLNKDILEGCVFVLRGWGFNLNLWFTRGESWSKNESQVPTQSLMLGKAMILKMKTM